MDLLKTHPKGEGRELLAASIGGDPFEHIALLEEAGQRKAKAEGIAYQMEQMRKSVLAKIAAEIAQAHANEGLSEARLERMARADERYIRHIEGTAAAIEERENAQAEYWRLKSELLWMEKTVAHVNASMRLDQP